ncbi:anti-repressor SinI family protein [Halobacillus salinarum]|uniref:Anti-repressor SinI family protein n=1 Tax=Halobacillus salinarum TaxID=2932257 RepID=A0ABY4EH05_9BACI|nr:DNA-binding anti-repressor SinI [Halobacillus salinarum]UOQ43732.1 anti-repressor SinI family protein [Halobacillus salinarum]
MNLSEMDWQELIEYAKELGLSKKEISEFLNENKGGSIRNFEDDELLDY